MRVIFSEPVDPASVTGTTLRLVHDGNPVAGEVGVFDDGLGAFFLPATELLPETGYTLVVSDGIKDTDGSGLKSPVSVAFTTTAAGDPVALRFEQPPSDAISGMPLRSSVVVVATDAAGRLAAGFTGQVTLTIGANPGGAVLHGATSGVGQSVEFGDLRLDAPGDGYTLIAASPGLPSVTSSAFDVVPARDLLALSTWESEKFPWDFRLFVLSADGRGAARIQVPFWAQGPDWSPDGTKIAFGRKGGGVVTWYGPDQPLPDDSLYVINTDGTSLRSLNRGGQDPRWSPDGKQILYSRVLDANGQPDYEIHVMNADGTGVRSLGQKGTGANWSPDGTRIAFTSELELPDGTRPHEIYVMNADGSGAKSLRIRGEFPVWSPDGSKLVFDRDSQATGTFVYVVNADGSGIVSLTAGSHTPGVGYSNDLFPGWSPDGSRIAYTRYDAGTWPVERFLHVMNADGSGDARIPVPDGAPEFGSAWQLDWSPRVAQPGREGGSHGARSP
jgi:Tol biopolymer transport system component